MLDTGKLLAAAAACGLGACAGAPPQIGSAPETPPNGVVEVYTRIARGAMGCWFAPAGPLKKTHVFYADVEPAAAGRGAEIVIHERDEVEPTPWGRRAFRIALATADGETAVEVENLALAADLAGRMRADVQEWRQGRASCLAGPGAAGADVPPLPARQWREPAPDPARATSERASSLEPRDGGPRRRRREIAAASSGYETARAGPVMPR